MTVAGDVAVDAEVSRLADAFFKEVVASDAEWAQELAASVHDASASQRTFYRGAAGRPHDVYDRYESWVEDSGSVEPDRREATLALADLVLFDVAKRVGTFESVSKKLRVRIAGPVEESTALAVAEALGASGVEVGQDGEFFAEFDGVEAARAALRIASSAGSDAKIEAVGRLEWLES